jgi:oxalate decarboxylase
MTVFDATSKARTFNYHAGDVGFVPRTLGHYIENIGSTTVRVINVFNRPKFEDISLNQWMALTNTCQGILELRLQTRDSFSAPEAEGEAFVRTYS